MQILAYFLLLLSGTFTFWQHEAQAAASTSNSDGHEETEHVETSTHSARTDIKDSNSKSSSRSMTTPFGFSKNSLLPSAPMKRFLGSIARQGTVPNSRWKRPEPSYSPLPTTRLEEQLDSIKNYFDSLVKEGKIPCASEKTSREEDSEPDGDSEFLSAEDMLEEGPDKRHISSLAGNGKLLAYTNKGRRFMSFTDPNLEKRHLGSLARTSSSSSGSTMTRLTGKRFLGSLARTGQLPYRYKRSLSEEYFPLDDENSDEDPEVDYAEDFHDDDDLLWNSGIEKKHIGSIARSGRMPMRAQRRPMPVPVPESVYRRHYKRRPSPSISARLRLMSFLHREDDNARSTREIGDEPQRQMPDWPFLRAPLALVAQNKRNIASLARNGMLPTGYRINRSASREVPSLGSERNVPPIARMMMANKARFADPPIRRGSYFKAPHAFVGLHDDVWRRFRRSISSLARQGLLRSSIPPTTTAFPDKPCDGTSADCDVQKRHLASLMKTKQLAGKRVGRPDEDDILYDIYSAPTFEGPNRINGSEDEDDFRDEVNEVDEVDGKEFTYPGIYF